MSAGRYSTGYAAFDCCAVRYAYQPIEDVRRFNADAAKMYAWLNEQGHHVDVAALIALYPGLMSFETWLRRSHWERSA
jgi:hypothetical protein